MKSRGLARSSESTGMIYWRCYVGPSGGTLRMGVRTKVLSTLGFSHLTRNSAQRGGVCRATELGNLKVTPCPGSRYPRTYLFFSKELKSRVPTSSWLSLWKGDPMRLLGNSKGLRGWGGVGGRDTAQLGLPPISDTPGVWVWDRKGYLVRRPVPARLLWVRQCLQ